MATLEATTDDLTTMTVDVVVNAANEHLAHGGGVAAALARAGGRQVQAESDQWIDEHGPLDDGEAAVTTAGQMPAEWIVHVVGPRYQGDGSDASALTAAVTAALDAAVGLGAASIALPAISAGVFGYPLADATRVIAAACQSWIANHPDSELDIKLVGVNDEATAGFRHGLDDGHVPRDD